LCSNILSDQRKNPTLVFFNIFSYFCNMEEETLSSSEYPKAQQFGLSDKATDYSEICSRKHFRIFKMQRYGRWYALKGLQPDFIADPFWMRVLEKEFDIGVKMSHPNIVKVLGHENDPVAGQCIVMDFVDGRTLEEFLKENPSLEKRKKVVEQLLSAIRYCHLLQVVHRDLKPSNILVTRNGDDVKLIDFGCADTDYHANLKGPAYTEGYAAPELLAGKPVDCRTDIYAFGVLLREIFPKRYRRVARRCTQADPASRYGNVDAVERAIKNTDTVRKSLWVAIPAVILLLALAIIRPNEIMEMKNQPETTVVSDTVLPHGDMTVLSSTIPISQESAYINVIGAKVSETSGSSPEITPVQSYVVTPIAHTGIDQLDDAVVRLRNYGEVLYSEFVHEVTTITPMYKTKADLLMLRKGAQMAHDVFLDYLPSLSGMSEAQQYYARETLLKEEAALEKRMTDYLSKLNLKKETEEQWKNDKMIPQLQADLVKLQSEMDKYQ
jgi:serine/threonine protein kinase